MEDAIQKSYLTEISLSRALARSLNEMKDFNKLPKEVKEAFEKLYCHHQWQMENGHQ